MPNWYWRFEYCIRGFCSGVSDRTIATWYLDLVSRSGTWYFGTLVPLRKSPRSQTYTISDSKRTGFREEQIFVGAFPERYQSTKVPGTRLRDQIEVPGCNTSVRNPRTESPNAIFKFSVPIRHLKFLISVREQAQTKKIDLKDAFCCCCWICRRCCGAHLDIWGA